MGIGLWVLGTGTGRHGPGSKVQLRCLPVFLPVLRLRHSSLQRCM